MATHSGTVRFITEDKKSALVFQTKIGTSIEDGYRLLHADFSSIEKDDVINYTYGDGPIEVDGQEIVIE